MSQTAGHPIPAGDRVILKKLIADYAREAALPVHARKLEMWRNLNDLKPVRPLVWINEIPWWEFKEEPELALATQHDWSRNLENRIRMMLYQWRHFPGDMFLDPELVTDVRCAPTSTYANYGIQADEERTRDVHGTAMFKPVIETEADVDKLRTPEVTVDRDATARDLETLQSLCDGLIPCRSRGIVTQWAAAWDQMIHWYGIERLYLDMIDRPELVHRLLTRFWDAVNKVLDKQIEMNLLATGNGNWRVGSGGLGCTRQLPPKDHNPAHILPKDQWGCSTGQIFSEVSPDMHWEFCLQYEKPYMERFGLSYYGCCEPLHTKIDILKKVRNLRKISISPWANVASAAEQLGTNYVMSIKPNPSYLAQDHWAPAFVKADLKSTLAKAKGARVELILKDITTLRQQPKRLWEWEKLAMQASEELG
jgi:hypothetical protein